MRSERSIFLAALEKETADELDAFLAIACAGNPALRADIEDLLRAHGRAGNVLDTPVPGVDFLRARLDDGEAGGSPRDSRGAGPDDGSAGRDNADEGSAGTSGRIDEEAPIAEGPGTMIGPYRLMEL